MVDTQKKEPWTFVLYFVPGLLYLFFNTVLARRIAQSLNLDLWITQIYIAVFLLFIPMFMIVYFYLRSVDGLSFRQIISWLGLDRFSWKNMGLTFLVTVPFVAFINFIWGPYIGKPVWQYLDSLPLLKMPGWYWQNTQAAALQKLPDMAYLIPFILMLIFNHLGEEVYFRGFLFRKTEVFLGKWTPLVAGLLFIAYHVFQYSKTLPFFPLGIFIAYIYYWRRDIYGAMLAHLLINVLVNVR